MQLSSPLKCPVRDEEQRRFDLCFVPPVFELRWSSLAAAIGARCEKGGMRATANFYPVLRRRQTTAHV